MSKKKDDQPHWLKLKDAAAGDAVQAVFDRSIAIRGYVRNTQRVLAHLPDTLLAQDALSRSLTGEFESGLSNQERELIALVVSVENRCEPCVFGHAAQLRKLSGKPDWVGIIEVNYRRAELTRRERALADYVLKITRAPAEILPDDLKPLRAAGVSETEIIEAAAVAAYFNFSNRVNSALGVEPNHQSYFEAR